MKKLLTLFAFAFVAFTVDAQSTQKGDVNGDGDISVNDVAMIVNYILGITDSNYIIANADINGDGEIDINDVMGTVSIILGDNTPQVYLTCPDDNHPHMIDLGLPSGTKWACCNVGATTPEGYGGYYAWGETEEKSVYDDVYYQYCTGIDDDCNGLYNVEYGNPEVREWGEWENIGLLSRVTKEGFKVYDIAGTQYDVAHVKWGRNWQMPNESQIEELRNNCFWDTHGWVISKINSGAIYFKMTGTKYEDGYFDYLDIDGEYWSSECYDKEEADIPINMSAESFRFQLEVSVFDEEGQIIDRVGFFQTYDRRCFGHTVRPVWVP